MAQGAFARLTGLGGWEVLRLTGPLNLLVLLTGLGRFVRVLTPRPWAPVLALAATALLWGVERAWWSGYLNLMSMTGNPALPVGVRDRARLLGVGADRARGPGTPGACGIWGRAVCARRPGTRASGVLYGLILLVHPITAVAAALGRGGAGGRVAAALVGGAGRALGADRRGGAADGRACWPYFDVFALAGDGSVDAMHRRLYEDLRGRFGLALLGLPGAVAAGAARHGRDPLVLLFALDCAVVAYGWVSGHYTYGRILGLTLVPLQLALAVELAAAPPVAGRGGGCWAGPRRRGPWPGS
ncbi:hypothetical protein GCM10019016_007440 [Streptomyces prasinosporus]|uniref:PAP2 superfamily protein n=1 Tax=Streptomyces prasinosporus TaxID=68256 RepID=A0ABP6TEQ2_9ACTN